MKFTAVTLFPQLFEGFVAEGLLGQAIAKGLVQVSLVNPRHFTEDAHHTVDDRAFGGGDGMVMKFEPLEKAVRFAGNYADGGFPEKTKVIVLSPQGSPWSQKQAMNFAEDPEAHYILVCGRYAGIDHRFTVEYADEEISIGDFILNGGEIAAFALIESVTRLLPGALGNKVSAAKDSFSDGLLECPQFTRPREVGGLTVPAALLSGDHKKVREFEAAVSLVRTMLLRPDLVSAAPVIWEKSLSLVDSLSDAELLVLGISREEINRLRD